MSRKLESWHTVAALRLPERGGVNEAAQGLGAKLSLCEATAAVRHELRGLLQRDFLPLFVFLLNRKSLPWHVIAKIVNHML